MRPQLLLPGQNQRKPHLKHRRGEEGDVLLRRGIYPHLPPPRLKMGNGQRCPTKRKGKERLRSIPLGKQQGPAIQEPTKKNGKSKGTAGKQKNSNPKPTEESKKKRIKIRPPRAAAVVLTPSSEGGLGRADMMRKARNKVRLEDLGISHVRPKIAATGAVILEIPGEQSAEKADLLVIKLREALQEKGVRVSRPVKSVDMRVTGLDESVSGEELAIALARAGSCSSAELKVGEPKRGPSGLGTAWAKCPAVVAKKLTEAGRVTVG